MRASSHFYLWEVRQGKTSQWAFPNAPRQSFARYGFLARRTPHPLRGVLPACCEARASPPHVRNSLHAVVLGCAAALVCRTREACGGFGRERQDGRRGLDGKGRPADGGRRRGRRARVGPFSRGGARAACAVVCVGVHGVHHHRHRTRHRHVAGRRAFARGQPRGLLRGGLRRVHPTARCVHRAISPLPAHVHLPARFQPRQPDDHACARLRRACGGAHAHGRRVRRAFGHLAHLRARACA